MSFTLSQTPNPQTLTLRPSGDSTCTELTPDSGTVHYSRVNEAICDEDTSYVYSSATTETSDLYDMDDTIDTGTIDYVKLLAWAKSADYMPSTDAEFKILYSVDNSECSLAIESASFDITTGYTKYHSMAYINADSGKPWTWDDIEDLKVGIRCSSPTLTITATTRASPSGDATKNLLTTDTTMSGNCEAGDHYSEINSFIKDTDSYVYTEENWVSHCESGGGKAYDMYYASSGPTLFVADGELVAYSISDGEYTELGKDSTYDYRHVWVNESTGIVFAGIRTPYNDIVVALSWNGSEFTVLHTLEIFSKTVIHGITGTDAHIFVLCEEIITGAPDPQYAKTYTYSGGFTLKDTYNFGNDMDTFDAITDSSDYIWVAWENETGWPYIYYISVFSINAGTGAITKHDDETTNLKYANYAQMTSDANYTYVTITQNDDTGNVVSAFDYTGGAIVYKGGWRIPDNSIYFSMWRANCYITFDGTYIYISTYDAGELFKLTFNGTTFTLVNDSFSLLTGRDTLSISAVSQYVYAGNQSWKTYDTYDMYDTSCATDTGDIQYVTLYAYCTTTDGMTQSGKFLTDTGGGVEEAGDLTITGAWAYYASQCTVNPETSAAWTWDEIEDLKIGLQFGDADKRGATKCSHYYAVVSYTKENYSPEIRTSQVCAEVHYQPEDSCCTLNTPTDISSSRTQNHKAINFWNGSREVYTTSRAGKTLVLQGAEYEFDPQFTDTTPCERIQCVRDMGKDGNIVSLSGLSFSNWNGDYRIRSFGWKHVSEKPEYYTWQLELEAAE